jgi:hypothetical protein
MFVNWIVILLLIVIGIFALRLNHKRHKYLIIFLIIISLFVYISMTVIATKNNLDLNSFNGFIKTAGLYGGWLANGFNNLKSITGNTVKMDWSNTNASIFGSAKKTSNK